MGKITTGAGLPRKAYMAAYNKGVNRSPSVTAAKMAGLSSATRKQLVGLATTPDDPGMQTQGSPGLGSARDYGKAALTRPPTKGGLTQKGAVDIPESIALLNPAKGTRAF